MFFTLYDPSIQSLHLENFEITVEEGQLKSLNCLLTQQARNIKSFDLIEPKIRPEGIPAFDGNQTKLPHLQTLNQGEIKNEQEKRVMEETIGGVDNLQIYKLLVGLGPFDPLNTLMSKGKVHTLREINMWIHQGNIGHWEKFADMQPTLQSWHIQVKFPPRVANVHGFLPRVAAVVNKILESSKDTLTSITLDCSGRISGIIFPVLNSLKKLKMSSADLAQYLRRQDLFKVFPNIKIVKLRFTSACTPLWDNLMSLGLGENCGWPGVHTLTINYNCGNYFKILSHLFPNLKKLVDTCEKNFPEACRGIFEHMKGLKSLAFYSLNRMEYPILDAGQNDVKNKPHQVSI